FSRGGKVGVDYGTDANNLPSPDQVSDLVKKHNIQYLRIYDSDPKVLKSLSNTALKKVGLQDRIKVSTPLSFGVLSKSYPPSDGAFDGSHDNVLGPLLDFLEENQSPFMVNLYPFYAIGDSSLDAVLFKSPSSIFVDPNTGFSYKNIFDAQLDAVHFALAKRNGDSSLDYVLFKSSSSIFVDPNTGLSYNNIFDAQLDVFHFALAHRNFSRMKIIVTETGWPREVHPMLVLTMPRLTTPT
ncbi:hypothetical protein Gogos_007409, partial [Gossypium gossypioides]|nr:hypothetical protein [Gossypium gossypioides]